MVSTQSAVTENVGHKLIYNVIAERKPDIFREKTPIIIDTDCNTLGQDDNLQRKGED